MARTASPRTQSAPPSDDSTSTAVARKNGKDEFPKLRDTLPGKTAAGLWRHRALHGPISCPLIVRGAAQITYHATGGADLAIVGIAAAASTAVFEVHRKHRARSGSPLLNGHRLWQAAVIGATSLYLGFGSAINPDKAGMWEFLGALTLPLGAAWWLRGLMPTAPKTLGPVMQDAPAAEAEPALAECVEEHPAADALRERWRERMTTTGGALPRSALGTVTPNPAIAGGGLTAPIALNTGSGALIHTAKEPSVHIEKILTTVREALPDQRIHPANVFVEIDENGIPRLSVFDTNPLHDPVAFPGPDTPGEFTTVIGRTSRGHIIRRRAWIPNFGGRHGVAVGCTGAGKSELLAGILNGDAQIRDTDGNPVFSDWLLDPHKGVSFPGWTEKVPVFARSAIEMRWAMTCAVADIDRRLGHMAGSGKKLIKPCPEWPMTRILLDEYSRALDNDRDLTLLLGKAASRFPTLPEMLDQTSREGRKTAYAIMVGTVGLTKTDLPELTTGLQDAITSGDFYLLRTAAAGFGTALSSGRFGKLPDSSGIEDEFEDGTTTAGLGYYARGDAAGAQMTRFCLIGEADLAAARFVDTQAARDYREGLAEYEQQIAEAIAAAGEGNAIITVTSPRTTQATPAPGSAAEAPNGAQGERPAAGGVAATRIRDYLAATGEPSTVREIATALGLPDNTVSMALTRGAEIFTQIGKRGPWTVAEYATDPDLETAGV
jgi:hypothetical protein